MAPRRPALVSAFAFLALSALASAAREPFDGAVHSHPGVDAEDDGMTETHGAFDGFADADWRDLPLGAKFSTRPSWQVPQYHVDGTYVRLRGWLVTNARAPAGTPVFRLPDEAVPGRRETWRVTMKGTDRGVAIGADGVGKLTEDLSADNWIPLGGFAFNSKHAGEEPRVLRPPLEGSEREALEDARTSEDGEGEEASETKDEL